MKYIDLIERFWEINTENPLGSISVSLYMYLLQQYKKSNNSDFSITDLKIKNELKLTPKTIKSTREKLRNRGLIQFNIKNGIPCQYKILDNPIWIHNQKQTKTNIESAHLKVDDKQKIKVEPLKPSIRQTHLKKDNVPDFVEFLEYTRTLKGYNETLDPFIEAKYDSWVQNDWKNGFDRPITNWQSSIRSTLPYLNNQQQKQKITLPKIHRPKTTYNE